LGPQSTGEDAAQSPGAGPTESLPEFPDLEKLEDADELEDLEDLEELESLGELERLSSGTLTVHDVLSSPGPTAALPALSKERIQDALRAEGWTFAIDSDGDIGGLWDANMFYFFTYGEDKEILQIRGRWHESLPIEMRPKVRDVLDDWHFAKIWPKAYTTVDDSGRLWVLAEHSVDWEHGVADSQLRLTLRCAIQTSLSLFRKLHERFVTLAPKD
jgi:hypothetical protein